MSTIIESQPTKDVTQLDFLLFNTSHPGQYTEHSLNAYALWKHQWMQTFKELGTQKPVISDEYLNRELGGLFLGTTPIGFILYQFEDFKSPMTSDLAYFKNYPIELLEKHRSQQDLVLIATYFTTDPNWRKRSTNYSISELLISFMNLRLIHSEANRMIGYFRNDRKTNEIFYRHGGEFIEKYVAYNVNVDFAQVTKSKARLSDWKDHAHLALTLWNKFHFNQNNQGVKNDTERGPQQRNYEPNSRSISKSELEQ